MDISFGRAELKKAAFNSKRFICNYFSSYDQNPLVFNVVLSITPPQPVFELSVFNTNSGSLRTNGLKLDSTFSIHQLSVFTDSFDMIILDSKFPLLSFSFLSFSISNDLM